ncbi:MAG TPA: SRPBCC family protein [Candidatus Solibacter sp.]|nr:SRPBCC family protein [Candidatus Solibacter sp.]
MSSFARSLKTTAPPEKVWSIWSDVSTWSSWNPDVVSMELNGPFAAGTSGTMTTKSGGGHAVVLGQVQPGSYFTVETDPVPMTHFTFHCRISPSDGGSEISQEVTMMGPLAFFFRAVAGNRIASDFPGLLEGLKSAAES